MKRTDANKPAMRSERRNRRGVAIVEGALVMVILLGVLFAILDLGLLVLEHNTLSEAARRLCREAMVHGNLAAPKRTTWGPTALNGTAANQTEYGQCLRKELATFPLDRVNFVLEWPDGSNHPDDRVRVTVTYQYQPIVPFVLGSNSVSLKAVSTMRVGH